MGYKFSQQLTEVSDEESISSLLINIFYIAEGINLF